MKTALQVAGLALAVLFAALAFGGLDWHEAARALARLHGLWLALGVLMFACGYGVRIQRWAMMLRRFNPKARYLSVAGPFLAGFAINNVAPLRAGDVARTFAFRDQVGAPPSQITATLVLERLLDLISLVAMFAIGLMVIPEANPWVAAVTAALVPALALGVVVLGLPLFFPLRLARLATAIGAWLKLADRSAPGRVVAFARNTLESLAPFRAPGLLAQLAALSALAWFCEGLLFLCVAEGLGLSGLGYGPWFSLSTSTLATLIPSTPGYVGTFDYFGKLGLMAFGAGDAPAAMHILICHVAIWLTLNLAGGVWLFRAWGGAVFRRLRAMRIREPGT